MTRSAYRGGPAASWEIVDGSTVCTVVLRRLASDRGRGADPRSGRLRAATSVARPEPADGAVRLDPSRDPESPPPARARLGLAGVPAALPSRRRRRGARSTAGRRTADVLRWLGPLAARKLGRRMVRAIRSTDDVLHWRIAVRVGGAGLCLDRLAGDGRVPLGRVGAAAITTPIHSSSSATGGAGCSSRTTRTPAAPPRSPAPSSALGGELGEVREALATTGHLSYPMVVFDGTEALMVPESAAEGVVRVYRAAAFPDGWEAGCATCCAEPGGRHDDLAPGWSLVVLHDDPGAARRGRDADAVPRPTRSTAPGSRTRSTRSRRTSEPAAAAGNLFRRRGSPRPAEPGREPGLRLQHRPQRDHASSPRRTTSSVRAGDHARWAPGLLGMHTYNRVGDVEVDRWQGRPAARLGRLTASTRRGAAGLARARPGG